MSQTCWKIRKLLTFVNWPCRLFHLVSCPWNEEKPVRVDDLRLHYSTLFCLADAFIRRRVSTQVKLSYDSLLDVSLAGHRGLRGDAGFRCLSGRGFHCFRGRRLLFGFTCLSRNLLLTWFLKTSYLLSRHKWSEYLGPSGDCGSFLVRVGAAIGACRR